VNKVHIIKEQVKEIIKNIKEKFLYSFSYAGINSHIFLINTNPGSSPARKLRDRGLDSFNRSLRSSEDEENEEIEAEEEFDDNEFDEENSDNELRENFQDQSSDVEAGVNNKKKIASGILKKKILTSPWTYFIGAGVIITTFIILLIISFFPPPFDPEFPIVMCGGPSKLDNLKVITRGPVILDMNGKKVKDAIWLDTWDFYEYIVAVVNNEVATGIIQLSNELNGKDSEIMKKEEYYRTIDFAYYQAQALASVSYALNPDVGNYLNEELRKANAKKYFEMCPPIEDDPNYTEEDILAGKQRRPNGYMLCNESWPDDIEVIVAANGVSHQTACSIKKGCYNWGIANDEGPLICKVEEIDGEKQTVPGSDPRCYYTSPETGQSNEGKKIYLRQECISVYKTNDGNFSADDKDLEVTCKNIYCEKFPDDPDCGSAPNKWVPLRAYLKFKARVTNPGVDTIDPVKQPERAKTWVKREKYLNDVVKSVKGVVLTDINGVPGRADFKGIGKEKDIPECKHEIHNRFPGFANDMCHSRDTSGSHINGFYQATVLRWPAHKILSYWYDFYFSSWSLSGRANCQLVDVDIEKKLDIFNYDQENMTLKFKEEKNLGEILSKYEEVRLAKEQKEDKDTSEMSPELEAYLAKSKSERAETEFRKMNQYIFDNVAIRGKIGTGKSVAGAAVALAQYVQTYGTKMPYTLGGNYYKYGANPLWGTEDDTGRPLGLDCIGFTNWSIQNGGIKPNFARHGDLANVDLSRGDIPHAFGYDNVELLETSTDIAGLSAESYQGNSGNNFARRVNMAGFGDIIYHAKGSDQFAHAKIVVGYAFNAQGVIVGNVVVEAMNPDNGIVMSVVSVRTGKRMPRIERDVIIYAPKSKDGEFEEIEYTSNEDAVDSSQIIYQGKVDEYIDFCFHDPNLNMDYSRYNINTSYCHRFSSEPYVVIDYSPCYEERRAYEDKKICEKEDLDVYSKGVMEAMESEDNL
jgi:cell wall-associated NlpC family hydrolase